VIGDLALALGERFGAPVDVADLSTPDAVFRREVASVGKVLFEDRAGRFKEFVARALIDHDDVAPFLPALVRVVARRAAARGGRR